MNNISAITIAENNMNSRKVKHIEINLHYLKDCVNKTLFSINYIESNKNISDIFTKSLSVGKFTKNQTLSAPAPYT